MNRSIVYALVFGTAFLAVSAGLAQARTLGYLSDETVKRTVQVLIGLGLAAYSNFTPKQIGKPGSPMAEAWKQSVLRVSGWSMVLAGLAYAALWAFAPMDVANIASVAVVATAMVITMGTAIRAAIACRALASS
ncbi:MAG: ammonium transporter [Sphingomonas sp.]